MGYSTRFTVSALVDAVDDSMWVEVLEEISQYPFTDQGGEFTTSGKWYDHAVHMEALSERFPGMAFELHGDGEEQGDTWKMRFLNGNSHRIKPEVIWPDFPNEFQPQKFPDWIEWHGGENPAPGSKVQVRLKNGDVEWTPTNSDEFFWEHFTRQSEANIVAYRVIEE